MSEVRAVLFDLDGVLVESSEAWFQLLNLATRHFCTPDVSRARFDESWGQGIEADVREFFPGCATQEVARFYEDHLLDFDAVMQVQPGARALLCRLRDADIHRGVVTNTPTLLARDILAWAGLIGLIDTTAGASAAHASKPAPDLVLLACEDLQIDPRLALVVGDSRFDAEAAAAARAQFLGFRSQQGPSVQDLAGVTEFALVRPRR